MANLKLSLELLFLVQTLLLFAVKTISVKGSDVKQIFIDFKIQPDVVKHAPNQLLKVIYNNNLKVEPSRKISPLNTKIAPTVICKDICKDKSKSYYTLVMTDPDVLGQGSKVLSELLHWLVVNIPGEDCDINKGTVASSYFLPTPPPGTGFHRYTFLLYSQEYPISGLELDILIQSIKRAEFSTQKFAEKYHLGDPIAGTFFLAESVVDKVVTKTVDQIVS